MVGCVIKQANDQCCTSFPNFYAILPLNSTDLEWRRTAPELDLTLLLCDPLTYAFFFFPAVVVKVQLVVGADIVIVPV